MMLARRPVAPPRRPNGSVAVPFTLLLPVILGFVGLAIDLSAVYLRNAELRELADSAALAAAGKLNGTRLGINAAKSAALAIAFNSGVGFKRPFESSYAERWTTNALFVSDNPDGGWVDIATITSDVLAARMMYVKVDTGRLLEPEDGPVNGTVTTAFIPVVGGASTVKVAPTAVAGRIAMKITPLGVCASTTVKNGQRSVSGMPDELVEFGYRRGVVYNLRDLNPTSSTPYLINPVVSQLASSQSAHFNPTVIKPFFCSGRIRYGDLVPGTVVPVQPLGPLEIHSWLNSRFDEGGCGMPGGAPPDNNIREYPVAGPAVSPPELGPLWAFKKPVQFNASGNYDRPTEYSEGDMGTLYPGATLPTWESGYPTGFGVPYSTLAYITRPTTSTGLAERRVLNIPLLNCSTGALGSSASVLGIGKFFMTEKATLNKLVAEFAGLAKVEDVAGNVVLLQ